MVLRLSNVSKVLALAMGCGNWHPRQATLNEVGHGGGRAGVPTLPQYLSMEVPVFFHTRSFCGRYVSVVTYRYYKPAIREKAYHTQMHINASRYRPVRVSSVGGAKAHSELRVRIVA